MSVKVSMKVNGKPVSAEIEERTLLVTFIRENLRLTVDQRFQQLMNLQEFAEELRRAGRKAREK